MHTHTHLKLRNRAEPNLVSFSNLHDGKSLLIYEASPSWVLSVNTVAAANTRVQLQQTINKIFTEKNEENLSIFHKLRLHADQLCLRANSPLEWLQSSQSSLIDELGERVPTAIILEWIGSQHVVHIL